MKIFKIFEREKKIGRDLKNGAKITYRKFPQHSYARYVRNFEMHCTSSTFWDLVRVLQTLNCDCGVFVYKEECWVPRVNGTWLPSSAPTITSRCNRGYTPSSVLKLSARRYFIARSRGPFFSPFHSTRPHAFSVMRRFVRPRCVYSGPQRPKRRCHTRVDGLCCTPAMKNTSSAFQRRRRNGGGGRFRFHPPPQTVSKIYRLL